MATAAANTTGSAVRHGTVEMMFGQPHRVHPNGLSQFDLA
jgi:hypothetical protein